MIGRGFDLTDESYYVLAVQDPGAFPDGLTHFGFVYHPLMQMLGGSFTALRAASLLITLALAFLLGWNLWTSISPKASIHERTGFALAASALALTTLNGWLPTPNYNTLTVKALLIAALAVLPSLRSDAPEWKSAVLLGFAGWLAFMAKPTSAVALGVMVVICQFIAGKFRWHFAIIAAACFGLLLAPTIMLIHGSTSEYLDRIRQSQFELGLLQTGHSWHELFRIDRPVLGKHNVILFLATTGTGALLGAGLSCLAPRNRFAFFWAAAALGSVLLAFVIPKIGSGRYFDDMLLRVLPFAFAAGFVAAIVFFSRRISRKTDLSRSDLALALFFVTLPHVAAFGTNNHYWYSGATAGLFWIAAFAVIVARTKGTAVWPMMLIAGLASGFVLVSWQIHPYRQSAPIWSQNQKLAVGAVSGPDTALYESRLRALARQTGVPERANLLDLTGTPGATVLLNARPVGDYWLQISYPGSAAYIRKRVSLVPCRVLAESWILMAPDVRPALINAISQDFGDHARPAAGTVMRPADGTSGSMRQTLLRPPEDVITAVRHCEARRMTP